MTNRIIGFVIADQKNWMESEAVTVKWKDVDKRVFLLTYGMMFKDPTEAYNVDAGSELAVLEPDEAMRVFAMAMLHRAQWVDNPICVYLQEEPA